MSEESEEISTQLTRKYNEFNVMKVRLDTVPILQDIETYLRGAKYIYVMDDEGNYKTRLVQTGHRKANEIGIQSIMGWLTLHINPQTVQGNFSVRGGYSEEFDNFMYHFHKDFSIYIMTNLYTFDIDENEFRGLVTSIRNAVERFLSRSIDNLERDSYGETTRSVESNVVKSKGGIPMFNS